MIPFRLKSVRSSGQRTTSGARKTLRGAEDKLRGNKKKKDYKSAKSFDSRRG